MNWIPAVLVDPDFLSYHHRIITNPTALLGGSGEPIGRGKGPRTNQDPSSTGNMSAWILQRLCKDAKMPCTNFYFYSILSRLTMNTRPAGLCLPLRATVCVNFKLKPRVCVFPAPLRYNTMTIIWICMALVSGLVTFMAIFICRKRQGYTLPHYPSLLCVEHFLTLRISLCVNVACV